MNEEMSDLVIVALRNEKGSYNKTSILCMAFIIVALRNEKGSYNQIATPFVLVFIVALRNEKGSYNHIKAQPLILVIGVFLIDNVR